MLQVNSLSQTFDQKPILRDFNLHVNPGEIVFLTGPSGSGKSTALRAISNLDKPALGTVLLHGRSPAQIGYAQWRRDVMYVPQHRVAHNGTPVQLFRRALGFAARNVDPEEAELRAKNYVQLCVSVGLERDQVLQQKWSQLSGGQAQRALVALCIALRPKVLLFDEPTSSCDHQSALLVEKAIVQSGIASIWVTHDIAQPERVGGRIHNVLENGVASIV